MSALANNVPTATANVRAKVNARFRANPLLTDYFPLTLDNGAAVQGVVPECSGCGQRISAGLFRGEVRQAAAGCYRVTSIGWCVKCDLLTPYIFHIVPTPPAGYDLRPLEFRGWPEQYESKVLQFKCETVEEQANT